MHEVLLVVAEAVAVAEIRGTVSGLFVLHTHMHADMYVGKYVRRSNAIGIELMVDDLCMHIISSTN